MLGSTVPIGVGIGPGDDDEISGTSDELKNSDDGKIVATVPKLMLLVLSGWTEAAIEVVAKG